MLTATPDHLGSPARGRLRRALVAFVLVCVGSLAFLTVAPASASSLVEAEAIALSQTATCSFGDVEITYSANGISRQAAMFTSENGDVLDEFETAAYQPDYDGTEFILTDAAANRAGLPNPPPVPDDGTVLGVYVTLGNTPPTAANAEFFLLYRCDSVRNDRGGANEVLMTCVGDYGTCPQTAQEALTTPTTGGPPTSTGGPTPEPGAPTIGGPARPATATAAVPKFTG
jgi:hypothetical protein